MCEFGVCVRENAHALLSLFGWVGVWMCDFVARCTFGGCVFVCVNLGVCVSENVLLSLSSNSRICGGGVNPHLLILQYHQALGL